MEWSEGMKALARAILLARYRSANPRSRATCLVPITFKTGSRQRHTCLVCGEWMTFCPRYRMPKQVQAFINEHTDRHAIELLERRET